MARSPLMIGRVALATYHSPVFESRDLVDYTCIVQNFVKIMKKKKLDNAALKELAEYAEWLLTMKKNAGRDK